MKIFQVDSFTDKPFKGNPAGVCLLEKERPDSWMQDVAMEMNLSETAFLLKIKKGFNLRWFTPKIEVSLCGHATLASAHILWEEKILNKEEPAIFNTKSGELTCKKIGDWIAMEFPLRLVTPMEPSNVLLSALNLDKKDIKCYVYDDNKDRLFLIELPSEEMVKKLTPDFVKLKEENVIIVMVTAKSSIK